MNINPPNPHPPHPLLPRPPSEVLLLCLQVALPGTQPTASRFHVAKGIILPFVRVGVYGLHKSVTPSQILAFISVFCFLAAGQPATCEVVFPEAPEQGSSEAKAAVSRQLRKRAVRGGT